MRFDAVLGEDQAAVPGEARRFEALGYEGVHAAELTHDPFLTAALAVTGTTGIRVGTQIAVAFARSPMTVAATARDLADLSGGRFVLGLGPQVAAHITRRFSMPWSAPAARMREYVAAVRAIWESWETGGPLRFRGEHYQHTLMTPAFSPGPSVAGLPAIHLAAVGPKMAEVAGAVADGLVAHPFSTVRYLDEMLMPAVERGLAAEGRQRSDFTLSAPVFLVAGGDAAARAAADREVRERIAFYGSTPAYRGVLEIEGRADLADRLHALSVSRDPGRWAAMADEIDDDVLSLFAVAVEDPADGPARVAERVAGNVDRVVLAPPAGVADGTWSAALAAAR